MAPASHLLLENGRPVKLRPREWDILQVLVARAGVFVSNTDIIDAVWPHQKVSEANLRVQIGALRRALGDGQGERRFILNATGRGYCFTEIMQAPPEEFGAAGLTVDADEGAGTHAALPALLTPMIGRGDALERLAAHLGHQRLLTISGPGGVGKTTLAIALAGKHKAEHGMGACFIDLGSVTEPGAAPAAAAGALGLFGMSQDATSAVIHHLRGRRLLLVLDNCEHLVSEVANLADSILRNCPNVQILATSREVLRLDGEWVHRLNALDYPARSAGLRSAEAMIYPAVQLFVARAVASQESFTLTDDDAPAAAEICRRLDGMPLALELAAARIDAFGVRELGRRLADSLQLLRQGRRSTLPRQQTLHATMEWSFALLSPAEQVTLTRLSVFKNAFSLEHASRVLQTQGLSDAELTDIIYELSAKSLVDTDAKSEAVQYRLLELTRAFGRERFASDACFNSTSERHAHLCLDLLRTAEAEWREKDWSAWTIRYGRWIDDIRAAIDWAYGSERVRLGIELVAASAPLAMRLSLMPEYLRRIDDALGRLPALGESSADLELQLRIEQCYSLQNTVGDQSGMDALTQQMRILWDRVSSVDARFVAASGLYGMAFSDANWEMAAENANRVQALIPYSRDRSMQTTADRMRAQVDHYQGRHRAAAERASSVIARPDAEMPSTFPSATRMDPKVTMRILLARSAWLEGRPDSAASLVDDCLEVGRRAAGSQYCYALGSAAIPVSSWRGDYARALEHAGELEHEATGLALDYWRNWARAYIRVLNSETVGRALPDATPTDGRTVFPLQFDELCAIMPALADEAVYARIATGELGWSAPELLRARADHAASNGASPTETEADLLAARALAEEQGALSWVLRIDNALARLAWEAGWPGQALANLEATVSRFSEGFGTPDFLEATRWLSKGADDAHAKAGIA